MPDPEKTLPDPLRQVAPPNVDAITEAPTVRMPPASPRMPLPASGVSGKTWRVDPLVAGLSLAAALLLGVILTALLVSRVRPQAASPVDPLEPAAVASPATVTKPAADTSESTIADTATPPPPRNDNTATITEGNGTPEDRSTQEPGDRGGQDRQNQREREEEQEKEEKREERKREDEQRREEDKREREREKHEKKQAKDRKKHKGQDD